VRARLAQHAPDPAVAVVTLNRPARRNALTIELKEVPCKVGFNTRKQSCPFLWEKKESVEKKLEKLQKTVLFRLGEHVNRENDPLRKILRTSG